MYRDNPPHGQELHFVLQNKRRLKALHRKYYCVYHFISDVTYGPRVVEQEESVHETTGFTDDNQFWLKPVTKKKRKQFLGSDGEEQQSDTEGSNVAEEQQSDSEGSNVGEEQQSDSEGSNVGDQQLDSKGSIGEEQQSDVDGSIAGEEQQSGSEESAEGEEVQSDIDGSAESEDSQSEQEEMSVNEDEDYRVRKLPTPYCLI
jgi:hypothetical protein